MVYWVSPSPQPGLRNQIISSQSFTIHLFEWNGAFLRACFRRFEAQCGELAVRLCRAALAAINPGSRPA
jgi:hypothetical protein